MTKPGERKVVRIEKAQGGAGFTSIEHLLSDNEKGEGCGLFAEVTIEVGATLGYHEHHGETETYYMIQGVGNYRDNDLTYEVKAGDVVFCDTENGHGLENTGDVDIKFIALILKK